MTRYRHGLTAGLIASLFATTAAAQDESLIPGSTVIGQSFGLPGVVGEMEAGETDLVLEAAVFFKNLELIGFDELDGQTFFGAVAPVRLRHAFTDAVSLELGVVAGHDFGDDDALSDVDPLVRIAIKPTETSAIVAGTLISSHWAHQALFDDTNALRDLSEQGLQVRIDRTRFRHDSWVNWRVEEGEVDPEEFEIGSTSRVALAGGRVGLDAQVLYTHAGGQISTSRRVDNDFAVMGGASLATGPVWDGRFADLRAGLNGFYSVRDRKGESATNGSGVEAYLQADADLTDRLRTRLGAGYFNGSDYTAPKGDPLYQFDDYTWARGSFVWDLGRGVAAETGLTLQNAAGNTNYTANINLTLNSAFLFRGVQRR